MAGEADKAFSATYTGTEPWISGQSWMAKAVEALLREIRAKLDASEAADATRDAAMLAAIRALTVATGLDPQPIFDRIDAAAAAVRADVEALHGQLAAAQASLVAATAELDRLRAAARAGAAAQVDQLGTG